MARLHRLDGEAAGSWRLAPAKINLFLHVGPLGVDSYHPLSSLVAFADIGDRLSVAPAQALSLKVTGPFADRLEPGGDNLVLVALRALGERLGTGEPALRVTLDKQLPVAAGLGGGSSDAGAALRLAREVLSLDVDEAGLEAVAGAVGADGPMCLRARSCWAEGRGDRLTDAPDLPPLHAVLVNPAVSSPTAAVYRAYDAGPAREADRPAPPSDWTGPAVIDWLSRRRNDLEGPATALNPVIGEALSAVSDQPGVGLARMSGSGATVFGLFATAGARDVAADRLATRFPEWWVRKTTLAQPQS